MTASKPKEMINDKQLNPSQSIRNADPLIFNSQNWSMQE